MKIEILVNGVKNIPAMKQGLDKAIALCATLPLSLDISYTNIDKVFDSQALHTDVVANGFGINPTEILNCATTKPDLVVLISSYTKIKPFNFSTTNPINPCTYDLDQTTLNNTLVMEICCEWYNDFPDVLTQFFLHELSHCRYYQTGNRPDLTHYQYASSLYSQKNPIDYYLYLIKQNMPQPLPVVTLTRNVDNGVETLGTLTYNNFTCRTLERPYKGNTPNISAVPKGSYLCKYTFSLRLLRYTYELQNVPNRSGIRIHTANYFSQLLGCIALGTDLSDINKDNQLDVINSKFAVSQFEGLLNRQPFTLQIV